MILIADSGSTKTDWVLRSSSEDGTQHPAVLFHTQGLNPIHLSDEQMAAVLDSVRQWLASQLSPQTYNLTIQFYGSGVRPDQEPRMERLLRETFLPLTDHLQIEAHSDLLGAARSLCGNHEGLACILGTGANSCLYDGQRIVANTPALGYIIGDEGSGAVLGIRFLNALYKGRLDNDIKEAFETEMQLTLTDVIDRVYRQPLPNRWLASLSPFISRHLAAPGVEDIVIDNFSDFIHRNIDPYRRQDLPLQAVGSIAFYYREQLCRAAAEAGYAVGTILRSPLDIFANVNDK